MMSKSLKLLLKEYGEGFETLNRAFDRYPYPPYLKRRRLAVLHYRLGQNYSNNNKCSAFYHRVRAFICDPLRAISCLGKV